MHAKVIEMLLAFQKQLDFFSVFSLLYRITIEFGNEWELTRFNFFALL